MTLPKLLLTIILCCISLTSKAEYHRSQKAKAVFRNSQPCPSTQKSKGSCPGYIIDHIKALACGGSDSPDNMQWQTKEAAKAKDKWERKGC